MDGVWQIFVALAAAMAMCPFAFFWGCLPCCQGGCEIDDGKTRTDPKNEGTWVPSGTWRGAGGVTWTFNANPGDDSGETWFFYGSSLTSSTGFATTAEQEDWGNICNWYSNKTTSPSTTSGLPAALDKRATRLPPSDAVVHIYTNVRTTNSGPATVKNAYFWGSGTALTNSSELTATSAAFDSTGGVVFSNSTQNTDSSTVNGGATFNDSARNTDSSTVNGGATFNDSTLNFDNAIVNGGATFNDSSQNTGTTSTVNGGATFNNTARQSLNGVVNDGAEFFDSSRNDFGGVVNDGAVFNDNSRNGYFVNGGATFNDNSINTTKGVSGGATFNDAACSEATVGSFFASPCTRKFVAHPTDLPTCNGTAPDGCVNSADTCGCG